MLSHADSNRCLDVSGASTAAGAQAIIWDCHGGVNQQWTRTAAGELRVYGDHCLDVNANGTADGTKVQSWPCNGTAAQKFTFNTNGTIVAAGSGKCVDVNAASSANGTARVRNSTPSARKDSTNNRCDACLALCSAVASARYNALTASALKASTKRLSWSIADCRPNATMGVPNTNVPST